MVATIAIAIAKAWPFEIQTSKSPDFKCFLISNGRISNPDFNRLLKDLQVCQNLWKCECLSNVLSSMQILVKASTGDHYSKNIQYLPINQAQGELESGVGT